MIIFENMIKHFEAIDINRLVLEAVQNNEAEIIDLNATKQLYEEGINILGVSISDYAPYSVRTLAIKTLKGQPTNRVTLKDEGDFESSFFIYYGQDFFQLQAADWKSEKLAIKYGDEIFGLTEENLKYVLEELIIPYFLNKVKYVRTN